MTHPIGHGDIQLSTTRERSSSSGDASSKHFNEIFARSVGESLCCAPHVLPGIKHIDIERASHLRDALELTLERLPLD
jgi:hypothetical protein